MARDRRIKVDFWSSEDVVELSVTCRLLFIGMWTFSDDGGVHPANVKKLKMEIFPADSITFEEIQGMINELLTQKLIIEYKIDDKKYWRVTGWKHQKIDYPTYKYPSENGEIAVAPRRGSKKEISYAPKVETHQHVADMSPTPNQHVVVKLSKVKLSKEKIIDKSKPKKKTDLVVPIENFELTLEVIEWGETQPQKWTSGEMQMHFDYFCNYLINMRRKPYKDLKAAFQNAVTGNWAKLRQYQHQPNKTKLDVIKERNKAVLEASLLGDEESYEQLRRID